MLGSNQSKPTQELKDSYDTPFVVILFDRDATPTESAFTPLIRYSVIKGLKMEYTPSL